MNRIRLFFFVLVALLSTSAVEGNDGVFYASGGTLVPLQETVVRLDKELLTFRVVDHGYAEVEIDFEFFNPGRARSLTVGFVTPPAEGDVDQEQARHPFITGFTVNVNGRVIPYRIKRLSQTSFKMGNTDRSGRDFVYYFPVTFRKGLNKIRHTYRFRGGASVEQHRSFDYQITTGKRWANKQIGDFELRLYLDNGIFAIPASFQKNGKPADWEVVGDGVIDTSPREWYGEENPRIRLAHLNSGHLRLRAKAFRPDNDLFFAEYNWAAGWTSIWCEIAGGCADAERLGKLARYFNLRPYEGIEDADFEEYSADDLRVIRNYFFAVRGYPFRDEKLRQFYGRFFWYRPNESVTLESVRLSSAEADFVRRIAALEAARTPKTN